MTTDTVFTPLFTPRPGMQRQRRRRPTNLTLRTAALLVNAVLSNRDTIADAARRLDLRPRSAQEWFRTGRVEEMVAEYHRQSGCCCLCGHSSTTQICGPCSVILE